MKVGAFRAKTNESGAKGFVARNGWIDPTLRGFIDLADLAHVAFSLKDYKLMNPINVVLVDQTFIYHKPKFKRQNV